MAAASAAASCSAAVSVTTWRCSSSRENEAYSAARSASSSSSSSSNSSVRMQAYSNNSIISSRSNSSSGSGSSISPMVVGREAGFEEGDLERPRWAGDDVLSRFVTALIAIKPLFNIMKFGARQVVIRLVCLQLPNVSFPPCCLFWKSCCYNVPLPLSFFFFFFLWRRRRRDRKHVSLCQEVVGMI